jgi:hypothetical protein
MKTPIEITTEYIEEMPESGNYPTAGLLVHYGRMGSEEYNRRVSIANAQVDLYNSFVHKFPIKFQMEYQKRTVEMCRIILRGLNLDNDVNSFFVHEFHQWIENEEWQFNPVLFNGDIKYRWVHVNYPSQITTKELYEIFIEYGRDNKIGQD